MDTKAKTTYIIQLLEKEEGLTKKELIQEIANVAHEKLNLDYSLNKLLDGNVIQRTGRPYIYYMASKQAPTSYKNGNPVTYPKGKDTSSTEPTLKDMLAAFKNVTPGKEHMDKIIKYWNDDISMAIYPIQEKVLNDIFKNPKYKTNSDHDIVEFKVKIVNNYYSTNLTDGFDRMVDNICNYPNFSTDVEAGNLDVIDKIRISDAKNAKKAEKKCLSFSSKYCSRIKPEKYPIYDNYVKRMLWALNQEYQFTEKFNLGKLEGDYSQYKKTIDSFIDTFFPDNKINYKQFDQYIWTWAKKIINEKKKKLRSHKKIETQL